MSIQSTAVSAVALTPGSFDVDPSGQATYRIDIELVPGVVGYQPSLAFTYASHAHNGLLGVGWALAGQSAIARVKATYAVDGFNGSVSYGPDDRLALDGQRLIDIDGAYGGANTLYYTEQQTWNQVRAGATPEDGFTVCTRAGESHEYGRTADSRILVPGGSAVRVWALSATTDRHGNRVEYSYTLGDRPQDGAYYLDEIRYTVRADMQPTRRVNFSYESRPDPISAALGGYPIDLTKRLRAVTVSLSGQVVRTYTLAYRISAATQLSCIATITQSGAQSDGAPALPPTTLAWSDVTDPGFTIGSPSLLDQHLGAPNLQAMNVSGSGRTDFVQLWTDNSQQLHATVYLASDGPNGVTWVRSSDTTLGNFGTQNQVLPCDVDGDGRSDLVIAYASGPQSELKLAVFRSTGAGFDDGVVFATGDAWSSKHLQFFAMDVNGDGRTDIVEAYARHDPNQGDLLTLRSYLSQFGAGGTFTAAIVSPTNDPANPTHAIAFWPMDVNGDGAMDLVRVWQRGSDNHIIVDAYVAVSRAIDDVRFAPAIESDLGAFALADQIAFLPVDSNGDGVMDLLQVWQEPGSGTTTLHLTTFLGDAAGRFAAGPDSRFADQVIGDFYVMDIDGGGATALVSKWIDGHDRLMFTAFRSSPAGLFRAAAPFDAGPAGSAVTLAGFFAGDANGDGKADLLRVSLDGDQRPQIVPYLSSGPMPDLVTTIVNPLGGAVALTYAPLSDPSVYQASPAPGFPAVAGLRYANPLTPTQFPAQAVLGQAIYVVASAREFNDPAHNRFTYDFPATYRYAGAQLDLLGRGWQGFASVTRGEATRSTTRSYNQNYPLTGTVATTVVADAQGVPASRSATEYTPYVRATGGQGTPIYEVLQTATTYTQYLAGAVDFVIGQRFAYDDYGGRTLHANLGVVDPATGLPRDPSQAVYHWASYQNDLRQAGWSLGFVRYTKDSPDSQNPDITRFLPGDYHLASRSYDAIYNVASEQRWDDTQGAWLTREYAYDEYGNRVRETQPGGATTTRAYDPDHHTFLMSETAPPDADGRALVVAHGYDPRFGVEVARQGANAAITITALDGFGRVVATQGPVPAGTVGDTNALTPLVTGSPELRAAFQAAAVVDLQLRTYADDCLGGLYTEIADLQAFPTTTARDLVWNRGYLDGRNKQRQTQRQTGQTAGDAFVLTDFDRDGKVVQESLPFFSPTPVITAAPWATRTTYDALGRPLTRSEPAGADGQGSTLTTWAYAAAGVVTVTAASGTDVAYVQRQEHRYYDGNDKVHRVTLDPAGANTTTIFDYDPIARLVATTDPPTPTSPDGVRNTIAWDSLDRRSWLDNPDQNTTGDPNIKAVRFAYDPATGLLASQTDAAGAVTRFTHDQLARPLTRALPDGRQVVYTYDDPSVGGQSLVTRTAVLAPDATVEVQNDYAYDLYGDAVTLTLTVVGEPAPFVTATRFDPQKRPVAQTLPDGTVVARTYSFARLLSLTSGDVRVDYPLAQRSAAAKPARLSYGADAVLTTDYVFNPQGQVLHETLTGPAGPVIDLAYDYDALAQLRSVGAEQAFTYLHRRLASATGSNIGAGRYTYDASGNLVEKDGVAYTYRAHYPVLGTSAGHTVFAATPDACGRTATRTVGGVTLQFSYDGFGALSRVSNDQGPIRDMLQDPDGVRVREHDATRTVLYVNAAYQQSRAADGTITTSRMLLDDRGVVAEIVSTGGDTRVRYLRRDHKGSNTHAFDPAGALVWQLAYDGYGRPVQVQGAAEGGPTYEQREWDAELGLFYFGARYYDPATGRYLTPDSEVGARDFLQPDALNRFAFELNNPINHVDPTGHASDWIAGLIIGLALIAVGAIVVLSGGAGTVFGAVVVGALLGAGLNGVVYSATHREDSGGRFWGGYVADIAVGAAIGAVTAGLSAGPVASIAEQATLRYLSTVAQNTITTQLVIALIRGGIYAVAGAALGATGDATNQFSGNLIDRYIVGRDVGLGEGVGRAALTGFIGGAVAGAAQGAAESIFAQVRFGGFRANPGEATELSSLTSDGRWSGGGAQFAAPTFHLPDVLKVRALLFGITESTAIVDATLEANGY